MSILLPALNEEDDIEEAVLSVAPRHPDIDYEIIVLDGGSRDATCEIVARLSRDDPRIRLVHNRARIQSAGVNLGVRSADPRAMMIVRADCHAHYPPDFVARLLSRMREKDADTVVVPMVAHGRTVLQRGIAIAQNSRLGNGGAPHRNAGSSGFVDHGHHAAFKLSMFEAVGGYDETFSHNEDAELDLRITQAGGRIWLAGDVPIIYYPRDNFPALARQYFRMAQGRVRTLFKHGRRPQLRQFLPPAVVGSLASLTVVGFVVPAALFAPALYVAACCGFGAVLAVKERSPSALLSGPAAIVMHVSYGAGFLLRSLSLGLQRLRA